MKSELLGFDAMEEIIRTTIGPGALRVELYVESTDRSALRLDDGRVDIISSGVDRGAGLRVTTADTVLFGHTSDLGRAALERLSAELKSALSGVSAGSSASPSRPAAIVPAQTVIGAARIEPSEVGAGKKAEMLRRADSAARAYDPKVRQVTVSHVDSSKHFRVMNSEGLKVEERRVYTRFFTQVVAIEGSNMQTGYDAPGSQVGFDLFDVHSPEYVGEEAARRAVLMLEARPAPSGPMTVVLGPGSGGVIFHEAVGHGLEGDHIQKGSIYSGRMNEQVAASGVTLMDDSTIAGLWGSYDFDDEGEASRSRVLIEDGVLRGYLSDRFWGDKLGTGSTGSSRRESYAHPPVARMSNTFLRPGAHHPDEILAATSSGIYARKLGGGQVDPQTGDFVFSVSEGYLIENGRLGAPVKGATLIGNGPQILQRIDMVGNDLDFEPGTCGKDGQGVPVCIGQPTSRVTEMTVGGTGGD